MNCLIACSKHWFKLDAFTFAQDIKFYFVSKPKELSLDYLAEIKPRYIFFPHWNWLVEESIYNNYECIVFHTAPLPHGRGGSPIQNLIVQGAKSAPVCALKMTSIIDGGPIYAKQEIDLSGSLSDILSRVNDAIERLMSKIIQFDLYPEEQIGEVYEYKRRKHADNEIPKGLPLSKVYDRIRMLDADDYPNAYLITGDYMIEFESADLGDEAVLVKGKIKKCK